MSDDNVALIKSQLRQLIRVGVAMLIVVTAVNLYVAWQTWKQESCSHRTVATINARARFNDQLDDITSSKFELDKKLTNRQLTLAQYNTEIDKLTAQRETAVKERNTYKFPRLTDCQ